MEIEEKYEKMLRKNIYNKVLDKFGYIFSLDIAHYIVGYGVLLKAFYDTFDSDHIVTFEDFEKGKIQFAIITGISSEYDEYNKEQIEDIKTIFKDVFFDDMIMYVSEDKRKEKNEEKDRRNVQMLHRDMVSLTDISADILANDFYSRELYLKWKREVLTEKELLYALVNHLSQELKRVKDSNFDYFKKYELPEMIKENSNPSVD